MAKLTNKQKQFIEEYLKDLNATQAAIRAGYCEKTSYSIGNENLRKPEIQTAIQKAFDKRSERTQITVDKVLNELALIGFANASDYFEWSTTGINIKKSKLLTREQCSVIAEVSETKTKDGGTIKVKLYDKLKALELIGKHLVMFIENVNHTGDMHLKLELVDSTNDNKAVADK